MRFNVEGGKYQWQIINLLDMLNKNMRIEVAILSACVLVVRFVV